MEKHYVCRDCPYAGTTIVRNAEEQVICTNQNSVYYGMRMDAFAPVCDDEIYNSLYERDWTNQ